VSLDDFPIWDKNSELATLAEVAFEHAVAQAGSFVVQQRDRRDYGTDFQLAAKQSSGLTNYRVHIQLKGTDKPVNKDGSISVSVARTNLNFLLSQPHSVYVCYHAPTGSLLVRSAEDVFRDVEHHGAHWRDQDSLTVRFLAPFDGRFQSSLRARTIAAASAQRDDRLDWIAKPPELFADAVATRIPAIAVPERPDDAAHALRTLYDRGRDDVISKAFDQFSATLGLQSPRLLHAYLAEINLAMRRQPFDRDRVAAGLAFIERVADDGADVLYCRANAHSALRQTDEAQRLYRQAIDKAGEGNPHLAAQCWKNLGSEIETAGDHGEARRCYERALSLAPDLMEAHLALALSHKSAGDSDRALKHLERVMWAGDEAVTLVARGHRLEVYLSAGMIDKAFDDIAAMLPFAERHPWVLGWCARMVWAYSGGSVAFVFRELRFWDTMLRLRPEDRRARKARLLCLAYAKMHGQPVAITYDEFVAQVAAYLEVDSADAAFLWDRAGHWAQIDGDWEQAAQQYRKACALEPGSYGYCFGTALNFLGRYGEALPILLEQASTHQPDAMSWFQLAVAQEGIGDIDGCRASYQRALELDPDYDLAMFNLGGSFWNHGPRSEALRVWADAIARFPDHELAEKARKEFAEEFRNESNQ
jgi:tetratricopeptide (TPR) repeat protein